MADTIQKVPHIPGFAHATIKLIDLLKDGKPGDELTYEALAVVAMKPVRPNTRGYPNLHSAIRHVEKEGVIWEAVAKEGKIRCLDPDGILNSNERSRAMIRRRARRQTVKLAAIDLNELPQERQGEVVARIALGNMIATACSNNAVKRLEKEGFRQAPALTDLVKALAANAK